MTIFCLILLLSVMTLWFLASEPVTFFGMYIPTCALRDRDFKRLFVICLLLGLLCGYGGSVHKLLYNNIGIYTLDSIEVLVILISSSIVLLALNFFSARGSVIYAVLGALYASHVAEGHADLANLDFAIALIVAPLIAFALSALIRLLLRLIISKANAHLITLSYYMRFAVIISMILSTVAIGLNWGGLMSGMSDLIRPSSFIPAFLVTGAAFLIYIWKGWDGLHESSTLFSEFSVYAVVSVGLSVAVTMLFFSMEITASFIGLCPVPLSASVLVMASVAGAQFAQRTPLVEGAECRMPFITMFAVPAGTFVLAYLMFRLIGSTPQDEMVKFTVITVSVIIMLSLHFISYLRSLENRSKATDRLVYAQQRQIYERSRALSDMELKVILSENKALHDAVEMKRQEVMNVALSIVEQKEFLESLNDRVKSLAQTDDVKEKDRLTEELGMAIRQRLSYDRDVDSQYFYSQAESLHEDFNAKLSENFPHLTQQEKRLATLLRLGFSSKYIATLMNITPKSVEISRYRLRQKLGLGKGDNLVNFIKSI